MKKHLSILMVAVLVVFASCSSDEDEKKVYTVTFETDGGTPVPSIQRVEEGSTVNAPSANPAKEGYAFVFWYLSGSTTAYNFQTPVNNDITLYARWQEETTAEYWQVTWNLNGGTWPSDDNHATQVLKGGTLAGPAGPTKEDNTFEGWYMEPDFINKVTFPYNVSAVTGNFTLYAKWTTEEIQLSVYPDTPIIFTSAGGTDEASTITVTTNQSSWDAVSGQTWCSITKSGNQFTVTASTNTGTTSRNATITVSAGKAANVTIEVTQTGVASVVKAEYITPTLSFSFNPFRAHYRINWTAVAGSTEYNVYKSLTPDGERILEMTTSDTTIDTIELLNHANGEYVRYYWVTAKINNGETSRPVSGGIKVTYKVSLATKVWMPNNVPPLYGYWMTVGTNSYTRSIEQNPIK